MMRRSAFSIGLSVSGYCRSFIERLFLNAGIADSLSDVAASYAISGISDAVVA
jgi:hypothetical protein